MEELPTFAAVLRDQRPFLLVAALASAALLLVPGLGGSLATWTLIAALWLAGAIHAAWRSRATDRRWLTARVGVQNVAIQLLVALPAIGLGILRMAREPGAGFGAAFLSNALVTIVALPALSAVILTCAALVVAVPLHSILRRSTPAAMVLAVAPLAGLLPTIPLWAVAHGPPATRCGEAAEVEIDHVPVAVRDLEAAGALLEGLGFTLKPGRPHENGLRNLHAKFADGREIELITIDEPVDELGRWYADRLAEGPGPVFLALHAGPVRQVAARLKEEAARMRVGRTILSFPPDHRWRHLFFGQLNRSPTDEPHHFRHANGAVSLEAVWLAGDAGVEMELLGRFGADRCPDEEPLAGVESEGVIALRDSRLYTLPASARLHAHRPIVGLTVRVAELGETEERVAHLGLDVDRASPERRGRLVVDLREPLGLRLEFRADG